MSRVVFITGASSGIGYATALAFAREGAHVAVTARRMDKLAELQSAVNALPGEHGDLLPLAADVRDGDAVRRAVDQCVSTFGRLDVVVANAGVGHRGAVDDYDWADVDTLLRTNIDGVLHTIRAGVPHLRASGGGHIILISSVVFNMVTPYAGLYSASKAFVSSLSRSMRMELAPENIVVTDILVGRTGTPFNERRLGVPGYAARAPRLPVMTPEYVAAGIVRASHQNKRTIILRPLDRLIVWANALIPDVIGRRAGRQYRVTGDEEKK